MVLFQNCVRQSCSPTKMAAAVQLRCYWKQLWSRWVITGSWEPLVPFTTFCNFRFEFDLGIFWFFLQQIVLKSDIFLIKTGHFIEMFISTFAISVQWHFYRPHFFKLHHFNKLRVALFLSYLSYLPKRCGYSSGPRQIAYASCFGYLSRPLMYLEIVLKNMTSYRNNLILDKYVHFTLF